MAHLAHKLVRQNLSLALLYNIVTVPLAVAGYVTSVVCGFIHERVINRCDRECISFDIMDAYNRVKFAQMESSLA